MSISEQINSNVRLNLKLSLLKRDVMEYFARMFVAHERLYNEFEQLMIKHAQDLVESYRVDTIFQDRKRTIIAFFAKNALTLCGYPRTYDEICLAFDVTLPNLLKIEKELEIPSIYTSTEDFVERFCDTLELPFAITKIIKESLNLLSSSAIKNCVTIFSGILKHIQTSLNTSDSKYIDTCFCLKRNLPDHLCNDRCFSKLNIFKNNAITCRGLLKKLSDEKIIDVICSIKINDETHLVRLKRLLKSRHRNFCITHPKCSDFLIKEISNFLPFSHYDYTVNHPPMKSLI